MSAESIKEKEFAEWEFYEEDKKVKYGEKNWTYDFLLTPECTQEEMYNKVGSQTIRDFLEGYNGTIFAYGQSGSGKTFSMLGPEDVTNALAKDFNSIPEEVQFLYGITPRAVNDIFKKIEEFEGTGNHCFLSCSYIEIYNEQINCLLNRKENLKIRESPVEGMYVADKEVKICKSPEKVFEVISIATKNRAVAGTNQNARSSRSHTILMIELVYEGADGVKRKSKLNLVDLAGSERIAKTGAEGQRLKEAQKINQSLTTLGMCIMALTTAGSKHIPYRNSKLTLILKESLGGSAKTTLLCTASRLSRHQEESIQTLYFASRAKSIKNVCKVNLTLGAKELQYLADNLKKEIMVLRTQLQEAGISYNKIKDPKLLGFISNKIEGVEKPKKEEKENNEEKGPELKRTKSITNITEEDLVQKYLLMRREMKSLLAGDTEGINLEELQNKFIGDEPQEGEKQINKEEFEENVKKLQGKGKISDEELNKIKEEYMKQIEEINEKNANLGEQLVMLECEKNGLQEGYNDLLIDSETMKVGLKKHEKELSEKEAKLNEKTKEFNELNEKYLILNNNYTLSDQELSKIREQLKILINEKNEYKTKYESAENLNSMNMDTMINLQQELDNKSRIETQQNEMIKNFESQIQSLNNKIKEKEDEITKQMKELNEKNSSLSAKIEAFIAKEKVSDNKIHNLEEENKKLTGILNQKVSNEELLKQKEKIELERKKNIETQLESFVQENSKLKKEIMELKNTNETDKNNFKIQINGLNEEKEINVKNFSLKENEYKNNINLLEDKINHEQKKNEIIENKLRELEDKNKEQENQIQQLNKNESKILKEKATFDAKLSNKDLIIKEKDNEILQLKQHLKEIETEQSQSGKDNESKVIELNEKIQSLQKEIDNQKEKLDSDENREKEQKIKIAELQKVIQKLNSENDKYKSDLAEAQARYNEERQLRQNIPSYHIPEDKTDFNNNNSNDTYLNKIFKGKGGKEKPNKKDVKNAVQNAFGVKLKKVDGNFDYLQEAKQKAKESQARYREIYKGREDVLKQLEDLQQNIEHNSPETISSRDDMADLPELDFTDPTSFLKAEQIMLEKEKLHLKEKQRKRELSFKRELTGEERQQLNNL